MYPVGKRAPMTSLDVGTTPETGGNEFLDGFVKGAWKSITDLTAEVGDAITNKKGAEEAAAKKAAEQAAAEEAEAAAAAKAEAAAAAEAESRAAQGKMLVAWQDASSFDNSRFKLQAICLCFLAALLAVICCNPTAYGGDFAELQAVRKFVSTQATAITAAAGPAIAWTKAQLPSSAIFALRP